MSLVVRDQLLPTQTLEIWREAAELAKAIANTDFVPKALRNRPEAVTAAILTGVELGLPPMASLSKIFIIDGRPGLYAEAMRALIISKGHEIWPDDEHYTATRVRLWARRQGTDRVVHVDWNMDMARAASLAGKQTWRAYPRQMLLARCTGELGRLLFADVLGGVSYTVEELNDGFVGDGIDMTALEGGNGAAPEEAPKAITRKAAAPKKSAPAKQTAPATASQPPARPALPGEEDDVSHTPPASDSSPGEPEDVVKKRSQMIAMRATEAGVDWHHLIQAITSGVKSSSKEVNAEEGADVLSAIVDIKAGRKTLLETETGWALIDVEDATGEQDQQPEQQTLDGPEVTAAAEWTVDQWRTYLATKGVERVDLLREADRLCREDPEGYGDPPGNVSQILGRVTLCAALVGWVEDNADPEREF